MRTFIEHLAGALFSSARALLGALCFILLLLASAPRAHAINASPDAVELQQPDGTKIRLHIRGDEFFHWFEDTRGYTVMWDGVQYVYANLNAAGQLAPTQMRVGLVDPSITGLRAGTLPSQQAISQIRRNTLPGPSRVQGTATAGSETVSPPSAISPVGVVRNLVVLCQFSDHDATKIRPPADYDKICNSIGGDPTLAPTGSVRDYYREASYGIVDLQSTVLVWVTLPHTEAYYANGTSGLGGSYPANPQGMVQDALNLADPLVDFGQFDADNNGYVDAIDIIHSGYAAETGGGSGNWIWSHKWSLWALPGGQWTSQDNNASSVKVKVYDYHTEAALWGTSGTGITRIGVICHETGHFFGLPDLYDTDGTSQGIGSYCLMANSWGFDGGQQHPPHFSAWCKSQLGWVTPTVITPGPFTAPQVETNQTVFKITNGYPSGEYLLIENRQPTGFETDIPQGGLAIWHIDENKAGNTDEGYPGQSGWPANGKHYKIALLQADGAYNMEHNNNRGDSGDVYRGGGVSALTPATVPNTDSYKGGVITSTNNAITGISTSSSSMTFTYAISTMPIISSPLTGSGVINTSYTYQITASNSPTSYDATNLPTGLGINTATGLISGAPSVGGTFNVALSATNATGTGNATLVLTIDLPAVLSFPLNSDPGWTRTGEWAFGTPTGGGAVSYGNKDPTAGATGTNVLGVNLSGDYATAIAGPFYVTTTALNLTGVTSSKLRFSRWLNTDYSPYAYATVDVSNNGTTWTNVYQNPATGEVTDSAWTMVTYDISSVADNQSTVFIRWGYQTGSGVFAYAGWNIDDVQVLGNPAPGSPTVTNVTSSASNGAYNAGATLPITVTFSSAVTVTGTPLLQLNAGASVFASYVSGSGTSTLTFNYVVAAGNNSIDLDYSSTGALSTNGGSISSTALSLPAPGSAGSLGANKALVIDTISPTVTVAPSGISTGASTIVFTLAFSEPVSGLSASGINVTNGAKGTLTGSGATYNLPVTPATQGTVTCQVNAGAALDAATNVSSASNTASVVYDSVVPTLSLVHLVSNNSSPTVAKTADSLYLTFTASEPLQTPVITIAGQTATVSNVGGNNWVGSTPASITTPQGNVAFSVTFRDIAGNTGTVVTTTGDGSAVTVDRTPPTLSSVHLASSNPSNIWAKTNNLITLTFTSSESIQVSSVILAGQVASVSNPGGNNWTASTTVGLGTVQGNVAFSVAFSDRAGNLGTTVTSTSDASAVTVDRTPPVYTFVHVASSNTAGTLAKAGDVITFNFTTSEPLQTPVATIAGQPAIVSNSDGNNWTASITVSDTALQGAAVLNLPITDLAGNVGALATSSTDGTTVTVDRTAPTLSFLHLSSSNSRSTAAKLNDTITLTFTTSESVQTPGVTLAGQAATVTNGGGNNWTATLVTTAGTPEGLVTIRASATDLAGNASSPVTSVSDSSSVTVDRTPPVFNFIHVSSSNTEGTLAKVGDVITLNFTTSEPVKTPVVTVADQPATVSNISGNNWTATITVTSATTQSIAAISLPITDLAGNVGTSATTTTDASGVSVDLTPPFLLTVHLTSSNSNPLYARLGDTLTLAFTASETLQTPVVTLAGQPAALTSIGGNNWIATRVLTAGAPQGTAAMSVAYSDTAGNTAPVASATTDASAVTIDNLVPQVTGQPVPRTVNPGIPVNFMATVSSLSPATFQWRKNTYSIDGATGSIFSINAAAETDEGSYDCVVTNIAGTNTTNAAALKVNDPVIITSPPIDKTVNEGEFAELDVAVTGTQPVTYVWRKNGNAIEDSNTPVFVIPVSQLADAGYYDVVVTNVVGPKTSAPVYLTVLNGAPRITQQPASRTVEPDSPVTFTVVAVGSAPFSYQWRKNGVSIANANEDVFNIPAAAVTNAATYTVKITNSAGSVISDAAVLAVKPAAYVFSTPFGSPGIAGSANASGPAARFSKPDSIVRDSTGNFFVTDRSNFVIRKITSDGSVTTFAGMAGVAGMANGIGADARFSSPEGLGIDSGDNLYVADSVANNIRRITPAGEVTTFAGDSALPAGSADGVGTAATFNEPRGIAVTSAGIVYVSEGRGQTVRQIKPDGTVSHLAGQTGVAGTSDGNGTAAHFSRPAGLAVDAFGNLYVADEGNHAIRKITPDGEVTTVAGLKGTAGKTDAAGIAARLKSPTGITVDSSGVLFVSDTGNHAVRSISPSGVVRTPGGLAGTAGTADGRGAIARFRALRGIFADPAGQLYIADTDNQTLRKGTLLPLPEINSQPQSLLIALGQKATFSVAAEGSPPLTYQWRKNAANIAASETTSKTPSYTTPSTTLTSAGSYGVVVTDAAGSVTSSAARLGVVNTADSSVTVNEGTTLVLTAAAAGESLTYEWRKNGTPLDNGGWVAGATSAKLSIYQASLANAGSYSCIVRMGDIALSTGAFTVSVRLKPVLTTFQQSGWIASGTVTDAITVEDLTPLNRPTSYAVSGLPAGMTFNKTNGQFGGKPNVPGHYTLQISATNAAGTATRTITIDVAALPEATTGTFNGLLNRDTSLSAPMASPAGATLQGHGGGLSNLVITTSGTFTGKLNIEDKSYSMPGGSRLDAWAGSNPAATVTIVRGTATDAIADLTLTFTIDKDTGELTGTVTDHLPTSTPIQLHAWRNSWKITSTPTSPAHPATALAGNYTALLGLDPALKGYAAHPDIPQGTGYVTLSLSTAGVATWGGKLADGTAITGSTTLGPNGELPLHLMLYTPTVAKTAGAAHGWIKAIPDSVSMPVNAGKPLLDGTLDWEKPLQAQTSTTRSYKSGFALHDLTLTGGVYPAPEANTAVLGLIDNGTALNARLVFSEGDMVHSSLAGPGSPSGSQAGTLNQDLRISTANKVFMPTGPTNNPGTVTLTLSASTGAINGNFTLKDTVAGKTVTRSVPWSGVLVPRLSTGEGQFQLPQLPGTGTPMLSGQAVLKAAR